MHILVTGATGNVGRPTVEALSRRGHLVRTTRFDLRDPSTWDEALDGVQGLFLLRPPAIADVETTLNPFVDAAIARGVEHVVFLSVVGAGSVRFIPHRRVEDHLRETSIAWTFLRAGFFAQNLGTAYRDDLRLEDRLFVPAGAGKVAWVDADDLGEAAALAFERPDARGAAWTLTGPEACTFAEVAEYASKALGRPIRYQPASALGYALHLRERGLPWGQILVQLVLHTAIRAGREGVVDPTLEALLGRRPGTVGEYLVRQAVLFDRPPPGGPAASFAPVHTAVHATSVSKGA